MKEASVMLRCNYCYSFSDKSAYALNRAVLKRAALSPRGDFPAAAEQRVVRAILGFYAFFYYNKRQPKTLPIVLSLAVISCRSIQFKWDI